MTSVGFFNLPREITVKGKQYQIISAHTTEPEAKSVIKAIKKYENEIGIIRKGRIPGEKKSVFIVYA